MRKLSALGRILKGLYNIMAGYLLAWILLFALAALGLHTLLGLAAGYLDFDSVEQLWAHLSGRTGLRRSTLRLVSSSLFHLSLLLLLRKPIWGLWNLLERGVTALERLLDRLGEHSRIRRFTSTTFMAVVTALLIPFVIQPTLVPNEWGARAWAARAANLVDGTATVTAVESVVGLYRRLGAPPVRSQGMGGGPMDVIFPEDDGQAFPILDGKGTVKPPPRGAMMDRWDPVIARVANGNKRDFALLKALIWVESAGRQFAVSTTGCVGLTQFCSRTARSQPYKDVFGLGQVYPCSCREIGGCKISRAVQQDLESGDMTRLMRHKKSFPCDLSDARFEPDKAISAARLYVRRMLHNYGNNIYLVYIGYNSGPGVAASVWRKIGKRGDAGLDLIGDHLAGALRKYFGDSAEARANSLLKRHLPKLNAAYQRYLTSG